MPQIEIEGLQELQRKYKVDLRPAILTGLTVTGFAIVDFLKPYPPSQSKPGRMTHTKKGYIRPMGWYERSRGWWSPIMQKYNLQSFGKFGKSRGVITGKSVGTQSVAGYKLRPVSERLREKWTVKREGKAVVVANSASYGPYVQSKAKQSKLMQSIGWKTDEQAVEYVIQSGIAREAISQAIMAKLGARS